MPTNLLLRSGLDTTEAVKLALFRDPLGSQNRDRLYLANTVDYVIQTDGTAPSSSTENGEGTYELSRITPPGGDRPTADLKATRQEPNDGLVSGFDEGVATVAAPEDLAHWQSSNYTLAPVSEVTDVTLGGTDGKALRWNLLARYDATTKGALQLQDTFDTAGDLSGAAVTTWAGGGAAPTWETGTLDRTTGKWVKQDLTATFSQTSSADSKPYALVDHGLTAGFVLEFECAAYSPAQFKECRFVFLWESANDFWAVRSNQGSHSSYPVTHQIEHWVNQQTPSVAAGTAWTVEGAINSDQLVTVRVKAGEITYYLDGDEKLRLPVTLNNLATATKVGLFAQTHRYSGRAVYQNNAAKFNDFSVYQLGPSSPGGSKGATLTSPRYDGTPAKLDLGSTHDTASVFFYIRGSRVGTYLSLKLLDSTDQVVTEHLINIDRQDEWQLEEVDLSIYPASVRDTIQRLRFTVLEDQEAATVHLDSLFAPGWVIGPVDYALAYFHKVTGQVSPPSQFVTAAVRGRALGARSTSAAGAARAQLAYAVGADYLSLSRRVTVTFTPPAARPTISDTKLENTPSCILVYRRDAINPDPTEAQWQLVKVLDYTAGAAASFTDNTRFSDLPIVPPFSSRIPDYLREMMPDPIHPPKSRCLMAWGDRLIYGSDTYERWDWDSDNAGEGRWTSVQDTSLVFVSRAQAPAICSLVTTPENLELGAFTLRVKAKDKPILDLQEWQDVPVVGTSRTLYVILGSSALSAKIRPFVQHGLAGPNSMASARDSLVWFDGDTVWESRGGPLAAQIREIGEPMRGYFETLSAATKRTLVAFYSPRDELFLLGDPAAGTAKVFDFLNDTWHRVTDRHAAMWLALDMTSDDGERYFVDSRAEGQLWYLQPDPVGEDGTSLALEADSAAIDLGWPTRLKELHKFLVQGSNTAFAPEVTLRFDLDSSRDVTCEPADLNDPRQPTFSWRHIPAGARGRLLQQRLSAAAGEIPSSGRWRLYLWGIAQGDLRDLGEPAP